MVRPRYDDPRWRVITERIDNDTTDPITCTQYWELYDEATHVTWRSAEKHVALRARTVHPPEDVWA